MSDDVECGVVIDVAQLRDEYLWIGRPLGALQKSANVVHSTASFTYVLYSFCFCQVTRNCFPSAVVSVDATGVLPRVNSGSSFVS